MWTLIKREIEDNISYYLIAWGGMVLIIGIYLLRGYSSLQFSDGTISIPGIMGLVMLIPLWLLPLCASSFGCNQMQSDKARKISTFLVMLATSRQHIFFARLISGLLLISFQIIALAITDMILLQLYSPLIPINHTGLTHMFITAVFINLACYAIGLQVGWFTMKSLHKLTSILLSIVIIFLFVIKGFGVHTWLLLTILTAASLTLTWKKFKSTSL
jgi:hypothetical protein